MLNPGKQASIPPRPRQPPSSFRNPRSKQAKVSSQPVNPIDELLDHLGDSSVVIGDSFGGDGYEIQGLQSEEDGERDIGKVSDSSKQVDEIIEVMFDRKLLQKYRKIFNDNHESPGYLSTKKFASLLSELGISQIHINEIIARIDINDMKVIHYNNLINYLITTDVALKKMARASNKLLVRQFSQREYDYKISSHIHRDAIDFICYCESPQPVIISGCRDGTIKIWDPRTLALRQNVQHRNKKAAAIDDLMATLDQEQKTNFIRNANATSNSQSLSPRGSTNNAITAMCTSSPFSAHMFVCCADYTLTVYDCSVVQECGRISDLGMIQTAVCTFTQSVICTKIEVDNETTYGMENLRTNDTKEIGSFEGDVDVTNISVKALNIESTEDALNQVELSRKHPSSNDTVNNKNVVEKKVKLVPALRVVLGDIEGNIRVIILSDRFNSSNEPGHRRINSTLFAEAIKNPSTHYKIAVHTYEITAVKYLPHLSCLVTASLDGTLSLVDFEKKCTIRTYTGHLSKQLQVPSPSALHSSLLPSSSLNQGIKAFSFSESSKYIISGAARKLLVWNPFSLETITSIDRLGGPVIDVHVSESDKSDAGKVIALIGSTMREIRVYDSVSFTLLQTVCDSLHANSQKGRSCLSAMLYIPHEDQFYTADNEITLWSVEVPPHGSDVTGTDGPTESGGGGGNGLAKANDTDDIVTCMYSFTFNYILTVSLYGTVNVYAAVTGVLVHSFIMSHVTREVSSAMDIIPPSDSAHPNINTITLSPLPFVQAASLDSDDKRLVVLTHGGLVQLWNIRSGECISSVQPIFVHPCDPLGLDAYDTMSHDINVAPSVPSVPSTIKPRPPSSRDVMSNSRNATDAIGRSKHSHSHTNTITTATTNTQARLKTQAKQLVCHMNYMSFAQQGQRKLQKRFFVAGTRTGLVCLLQDTGAQVDTTPSMYLRRKTVESWMGGGLDGGMEEGEMEGLWDKEIDTRLGSSLEDGPAVEDIQTKSRPTSRNTTLPPSLPPAHSRTVLWTLKVTDSLLATSYADGKLSLWDTDNGVEVYELMTPPSLHPSSPSSLPPVPIYSSKPRINYSLAAVNAREKAATHAVREAKIKAYEERMGLRPKESPPRAGREGGKEGRREGRQEGEKGVSMNGKGESQEEDVFGKVKGDEEGGNGSRIVANCAVLHFYPLLLIAACSDRYFRIWDIRTGNLMCMCTIDVEWLGDDGQRVEGGNADADADASNTSSSSGGSGSSEGREEERDSKTIHESNILHHLVLSESQDALVGAFPDGRIRVWAVYTQSLLLLERSMAAAETAAVSPLPSSTTTSFSASLVDIHGTLSIPPLIPIVEFQAHIAPLLCLRFVWAVDVDDEHEDEAVRAAGREGDKARKRFMPPTSFAAMNSLTYLPPRSDPLKEGDIPDGFLLTACTDQSVVIWTMNGTEVGRPGKGTWDLTDEGTFKGNLPSNLNHLISWIAQQEGGIADDGGDGGSGKEGAKRRRKEEQAIARWIRKQKPPYTKHTEAEMHAYVYKLNSIVANRQPASQAMSEHFNYLTSKHPISEAILPPPRKSKPQQPQSLTTSSPAPSPIIARTRVHTQQSVQLAEESLQSLATGAPSQSLTEKPMTYKAVNTRPAASIHRR